MKIRSSFPFLGAVCLLMAGCSRAENQPSASASTSDLLSVPDVEVSESALQELYVRVSQTFDKGLTNEANQIFFGALQDEAYAPASTPIFCTLIRYLLATGQLELAQKTFLERLRTAPDDAIPAQDYIYGYLLDVGQPQAALDWAKALVQQDVPPAFRLAATGWLANGQLTGGDPEGSLATLSGALTDFPAADSVRLASALAQSALAGPLKNLPYAEGVVAAIEASPAKDSPEGRSAVWTLTLRLRAVRAEWSEIVESLPSAKGVVSDVDLMRALNFAYRLGVSTQASQALESISSTLVHDADLRGFASARTVSARQWVDCGLVGPNGGPAIVSERLNALLSLEYPPSYVFMLYAQHFYDLIGTPEILRENIALARRLRPLLSEPSDLAQLSALEMDGDFLLEDWDGALAILEAGLPDHDAAWHQLSITKVKAHKELSAGHFDEAAKLFRDFIGMLPDEEQPDPATGVVYTREMLGGMNEKRIGDFYAKAGEADKAAKAYEAARKWYADAAAKDKLGATTAERIEQLTKELEGTIHHD